MKYFISYATKNYGFGNAVVEVKKAIKDYDDLLAIEEHIMQEGKIMELPVVLHYIRIYDD